MRKARSSNFQICACFMLVGDRVEKCEKKWCGRVDSNHHGIATASPSSWCVCQFRHDRITKSRIRVHFALCRASVDDKRVALFSQLRLVIEKRPTEKRIGCYKARIDMETAPRTFDTDALLDVECGVVSNHGHSRGFLRALIANHQDFAMAEAPWDPRCDRLAAVNCAAGIPFARGRFFESNCSQPATEEFFLAICSSQRCKALLSS